jgi:deaminated glutathione amidase
MSKIAAIQMCSSTSVDENIKTAADLISLAAANGAKMAVLPEMFPLMTKDKTHRADIKEAFGKGRIQSFLANQAKKSNIWIIGGTIPLTSDNSHKATAACLVYDNNGENVARYDKIHLFDANLDGDESYNESHSTEPGNKIVVIDTPFGRLGLSVCYDIRFPTLYSAMSDLGAEIIAVPAAFTATTGKDHWEVLTRCRAIENSCYIIAAGQGGTHESGRESHGNSMIINPWGEVIQQSPKDGNCIIYANIDLKKLHDIRKSMPIIKHRKLKINPIL